MDPAGSAQIPPLAGVDVAALLRRMRGRSASVLRLLRHYRDHMAGAVSTLRAALAAGDLESARIQAHSLKGSAANLGMDGVAEAARAVEGALRDGDAEHGPALDRLEAAHRQVLQGLGALPEAPDNARDAAGGLARLRELFADLDRRLAASDASSATSLEELRRALAGSGGVALEQLGVLVHAYDFEGARRHLAELGSTLEVSWPEGGGR